MELGDRARLAGVLDRLSDRSQPDLLKSAASAFPPRLRSLIETEKHLLNDNAALVADLLQDTHDLQIAQALYQAGEKQHACDKQSRYHQHG